MAEFVSCIRIDHCRVYHDFIDTSTNIGLNNGQLVCYGCCELYHNKYYITIHDTFRPTHNDLRNNAPSEFTFNDFIDQINYYSTTVRYSLQIIKTDNDDHFVDIQNDDYIISFLKQHDHKKLIFE